MFRLPFSALTTMLALSVTSPAAAQDLQRGDPPDSRASGADIAVDTSTDLLGLDRDVAVRDSTRAVLAEAEARSQVDQARLDSLQVALESARDATPRDAAAATRAADLVKEAKKAVAHDLARTRRERARLAALERKVVKESDAPPERSASRDSASRR